MWDLKPANNVFLDLLGNSYTLQQSEDIEKGYFNILEINEKIIMQMKSEKDTTKFYLLEISEKKNVQRMVLTKIKLSINDVTPTGDEPIIFEREN